jgi:FMN phosphatase YigB (HAD superfamily)
MQPPHEAVFLFDVDNTLLDNDRVTADLRAPPDRRVRRRPARRYWEIFEELRERAGVRRLPGRAAALPAGAPARPQPAGRVHWLVNYPFANRLYPGSLDAIERTASPLGPVAILSDGDVVFQPRKVERSGLWDAVDGNVLIYIHKEEMLDDVEARFPARRYVMVDDKLRILDAMRERVGRPPRHRLPAPGPLRARPRPLRPLRPRRRHAGAHRRAAGARPGVARGRAGRPLRLRRMSTMPPAHPAAPPAPAPAPSRWRAGAAGTRGRARRVLLAIAFILLLAIVLGLLALPAPGLPDPEPLSADARGTVVTAAAPRYRAGWPHRALLGAGHRALWATPVRLEVLDLGAIGGGLTPERRGGGNQTRSLHFRGADGREYVFRSLDKDQTTGMGGLRRATLGRLRQDQVGALHPAGALVAAGLADAAGVPHTAPRLAVMPNAAALDSFRAGFAGMVGMLEERPKAGAPGFERVTRLVGTDELWPELRKRPNERVDARAFLATRLLDVYLGDWDRHEGQWRWARVERGGGHAWVPVPRDRDYALVDYRGALAVAVRPVYAKATRFDGEYRDLEGLLVDARPLDRRFLCALPPAAWDSAAGAMRRALGDEALTAAVRRMPPEYVRVEGAALLRTLRARRDHLPGAARRFRAALEGGGECAASPDR